MGQSLNAQSQTVTGGCLSASKTSATQAVDASPCAYLASTTSLQDRAMRGLVAVKCSKLLIRKELMEMSEGGGSR